MPPLITSLCRKEGWEVRLLIGAQVARRLGGTGSLAMSTNEGALEVPLQIVFDRDELFDEFPQGTARLLRPSKGISSETVGLWSALVAKESQYALECCLQCTGIGLPGEAEESVPPGPLYLSAILDTDDRATRVAELTAGRVIGEGDRLIKFGQGRVTAKEYSMLGQWTGLSELNIVGSLEARPLS